MTSDPEDERQRGDDGEVAGRMDETSSDPSPGRANTFSTTTVPVIRNPMLTRRGW